MGGAYPFTHPRLRQSCSERLKGCSLQSQLMEERRITARARTRLTGRVLERAALSDEPCLVQNLSSVGASVVFPEGATIPKRFDLFIGHDNQAHHALTIWRKANVAGVRFLEARPNAPKVFPN
jgi:hypothetical protein